MTLWASKTRYVNIGYGPSTLEGWDLSEREGHTCTNRQTNDDEHFAQLALTISWSTLNKLYVKVVFVCKSDGAFLNVEFLVVYENRWTLLLTFDIQ